MKTRFFKSILAVFGSFAMLFLCCTDFAPLEFPSREELEHREGRSSSEMEVYLSSSAESSSSEELSSSSSSVWVAGITITKDKLSGFSQKGPFAKGSSITIWELDGSLAQTGRSFNGAIADNKGNFEIKSVELASPYLRLKADGYYRNEMSGNLSNSPITLYALADVNAKSSANVNLLTHLEAERVQYLVGAGKGFDEAKRQAQGEILDIFGFEGDYVNSDDLSIFGTGEGDAVLLAVSVLLQGERGEADFSELLAKISQSIKLYGLWNDVVEKALIRSWACSADLAVIRGNVLGWGFSASVPDFEKYVRAYCGAVSSSSGTAISYSSSDAISSSSSGVLSSSSGDVELSSSSDVSSSAQSSSSVQPSSSSETFSSSSVVSSSGSVSISSSAAESSSSEVVSSSSAASSSSSVASSSSSSFSSSSAVVSSSSLATYTVTYNAGTGVTGVAVPSNQTKSHDVALTLSTATPTRAGYTFAGWNTAANGSGLFYAGGTGYTDNANLTLYAQWTANTYTVTYNANSGSGAPASQTKTHDIQLTLSLTEPTRTNYIFTGWNTEIDGTGTPYAAGSNYIINANVTLYAQWILKTYTVTYNANGGTGAPEAQTKNNNVSLKLSATVPTRTGYVFARWDTEADGNGTSYAAGGNYTVNANVTLYAQWTAIYTVTFDANGGTGAPAEQTKTHDVSLKLSTVLPLKTGYDFTGWNTATDGTGTSYSAGNNYTINANVTLYAQWTLKTYAVMYYDANGATGMPEMQTKIHDEPLTLSATVPTRTGYEFTGWTAFLVGGTYAAGGSYTDNVGITLLAQWTANCSLNGGTVNIGNQIWMAENLNCNLSGASRCYDDDPANCDKYGRLYSWVTAIDLNGSCSSTLCASKIGAKHKGICPTGWHLPSKDEWDALKSYIENNKNCTSCDAKHLKAVSSGYCSFYYPCLDSYGFRALPGGYGYSGGNTSYEGERGIWLSSSEYASDRAYIRSIYKDDNESGWQNAAKSVFLFSVRCVQD